MQIRISNILKRTKVEGPETRYCIWTQGCTRHCKGCQAVHTWSHKGGQCYDVGDIVRDIYRHKSNIEGITFLGGEPFEQAEAVGLIARECKLMGLGVLTFSGNYLEDLRLDSKNLMLIENTDLLIDGPFEVDKVDYSRPWCGSKNQRYHFLTDRYDESIFKKYKNKVEINISQNGLVFMNGMGNFSDILHKIDLQAAKNC